MFILLLIFWPFFSLTQQVPPTEQVAKFVTSMNTNYTQYGRSMIIENDSTYSGSVVIIGEDLAFNWQVVYDSSGDIVELKSWDYYINSTKQTIDKSALADLHGPLYEWRTQFILKWRNYRTLGMN
jgi:hypothetical protein